MQHAFRLGDAEHNLALSRSATAYRLHLEDGRELPTDLRTAADGRTWLTLGDQHVEVIVAIQGDEVFIHFAGEAHRLRYLHPLERLAAQSAGGADDIIRAPMPGSIVSVNVSEGEQVSKGRVLLVMESMKMETTISAPRDGVVQRIAHDKGQIFDRDAVLISLEPVVRQESDT
ncbi:biotin/lipoyl-binding protein [Pseudomonas sp. R3.Fl]|uniref:acetyl-CoA carboxylase biotin carboxyl carrier protein subunit n=1 Tax=Pseudomonas sp. R3.Fl TaxID=2928708 RepID=UPI00201DD192|nr:biotin/lipoyl-binding protein [Pseudomonas sp. R3.Fl]